MPTSSSKMVINNVMKLDQIFLLPEDSSARIPKAILPAVTADAESQGFDTSKIWFHGSRRAFKTFGDPSAKGVNEWGVGICLTDRWNYANSWARQGGYVYECYIRRGEIFDY